jgi:hypothetical protein
MATLLFDGEHWRQKAAEMRAAADGTTESAEREIFRRLAADYEHLAVRADARAGMVRATSQAKARQQQP